jgi:glycosyltransferase involved in cell wall biosynthesis
MVGGEPRNDRESALLDRFSIIIPAHDESDVIERCLRSITRSLSAEEAEIIVVCNGCSDDTADIAMSFGPMVRVLCTPVPSKPAALNLGDTIATRFPRIYLDADIVVDSDVVRDLAHLLDDDSPLLAASPRGVVSLAGRGRLVRSFYRIWTALPYFREGPFGAGLYAFSRKGRERFKTFPDIISDDGFARLSVHPSERGVLESGVFTIFPPRSISGVLKINIRARAGMYQLRSRFPEMIDNGSTSALASLGEILRNPQLWLDAPIYLAVTLIASLGAHIKLLRRRERHWERDHTSREKCVEN